MEQIDYQQGSHKLFAEYLADPAALIDADLKSLESLVAKFPYCQLFHFFYCKALQSKKTANNKTVEAALSKSALYAPDRKILYAIINRPETLKLFSKSASDTEPVEETLLVSSEAPEQVSTGSKEDFLEDEIPFEEVSDFTKEQPFEKESVKEPVENELSERNAAGSLIVENTVEEVFVEEADSFEQDESENTAPINEKITEKNIDEENPVQEAETLNIDDVGQETVESIEPVEENMVEENSVFKETEPVNINTDNQESSESIANTNEIIADEKLKSKENSQVEQLESEVSVTDETIVENENSKVLEIDEAEKLILSNITSADYFAFEEKRDAHTQSNLSPQPLADVPLENLENQKEKETEKQVSKYDDDEMPYTFLWWLNRTRKEHAHTYQPYASFKLDTSQNIKENSGDELNHQIIENIFHLQSPIKEVETKTITNTVHFEIKRKEGEIIEKFIKEEPQIKPPKPENLNMENKARKSAEDPNDLVSETLAAIYTDQMLFHKAIDTYQKLSLKFPEKSTYFADQIRELEKKIN